VLVASPRRDAVDEALFFAERLGRSHIAVQGLVVNRLHPRFDAGPGEPSATHASGDVSIAASASGDDRALAALVANRDELRAMSAREEGYFAALASQVAPAPVARVPFLADDVHDLGGLAVIADHLFGQESPAIA
jgi:anion-transporting  ArsA/GET3 family ATPase